MEIPAISIIVPIFNMEWCMQKCIDSILAQTFENFECLLIDDGSTDRSPAICDEYAQKDARIKVYHKPNGGLSDARNYGLERALGEYTIFADPDDWVDAEGLDQLYEKAKKTNADMVMCDIYYNDPHRQRYRKQEPTSLEHLDVLKDLITGKVYGFTVTKLIKRCLYQKNNINYPQGMYGCEDQYTMCKLLKNDIKIAYIPIAFYHYMHYGNETLSRKYDKTTFLHDIKIRDMFTELLTDTPFRKLAYEQKSLYMVYRAFHFGNKIFTAKSYRIEFEKYESILKAESGYMKCFLLLSIKGYYPIARNLFSLCYKFKQLIKLFKIKITPIC